MRAFIKEDMWDKFKELSNKYKFFLGYKPNKFFSKLIEEDMMLIVNKKTRELHLITPMGESPYMEVHTNMYQDLLDDGYIEFQEGRFD